MIKEYPIIKGLRCSVCGTKDDTTYDEDGNEICTDCLFERETEVELVSWGSNQIKDWIAGQERNK
jgi:hypothetical protein